MSTDDAGIFNLFGSKAFDECLDAIKKEYKSVCDSRDSLREQLRNWDKGEEIQAARKQAEKYRQLSLCQCSEREIERMAEFRSRHYQSCKNAGCYQYELTGTGIGTDIKIKCPQCGVEEDVTDYECW